MISIITPFYNGNEYISQLVNNINYNAINLHLKYPEMKVELIIVNDSPQTDINIDDNTEKSEILLSIVKNNENMGIHYSRVHGLKYAKGNYIVFLDQDDVIYKDFLLSQIENIKENDVIVCAGVHACQDKDIRIYKNKYQHNCVKDLNKYISVRQQIISPGQCLIKKTSIPMQWCKMIMKNNGADDYFLWILMLAQKRKFAINGRLLYKHVITGNNKSAELRNMDKSVDEMVGYLQNISCLSKKQKRTLKRCNKYKQNFRYSGRLMKILYSMIHIDLAIKNIIFNICSIPNSKTKG